MIRSFQRYVIYGRVKIISYSINKRWDMDSTSTNSITDDQELAKVLESMNQQVSTPDVPAVDNTQDETPAADTPTVTDETPTVEESPAVETTPEPEVVEPAPEPTPEPVVPDPIVAPSEPSQAPTVTSDLDSIKKTALEELRPLVDKLDLPADEKFDTLLLLIRSTDDKSLVSAAHEAAREISDETKRAQALLDVIKEIDYFSGHGQQPQ